MLKLNLIFTSLIIILLFAIGGCGSDNTIAVVPTATYTPSPTNPPVPTNTPGPTSTPTQIPVTGSFTLQSTGTVNHSHDIVVYLSDLAYPPSSGVIYTSSLMSGHSHKVTITQEQLNAINKGDTVTVVSSVDDYHSHTWILRKSFRITSSLSASHSHDLDVMMVDLSNPPDNGVTYTSTTGNEHCHTVSLTKEQLIDIKYGKQVYATSSSVNGHNHIWIIIKP